MLKKSTCASLEVWRKTEFSLKNLHTRHRQMRALTPRSTTLSLKLSGELFSCAVSILYITSHYILERVIRSRIPPYLLKHSVTLNSNSSPYCRYILQTSSSQPASFLSFPVPTHTHIRYIFFSR